MNYKGRDIELQSGDIILFSNAFVWYNPMRWLSSAIRYFTNAEYNHVAVAVDSWGVLMLNEARPEGLVSRPALKYLHRHLTRIKVLRYRHAIHEGQFCRKANSKLGIGYDYPALVFHQLWYRLTGVWKGSTAAFADGKMVCSEYGAWCYDLPQWWLYSAKELELHPDFQTVYEE